MIIRKIAAASAAAVLATSALAQAPSAPKASGGGNLGSAQLYANVSETGALIEARSKGTIACTIGGTTCRSQQGVYQVNFARDVSNCAYAVTVDTFHLLSEASALGGAPQTVRLSFVDRVSGIFTDANFRLLVIC